MSCCYRPTKGESNKLATFIQNNIINKSLIEKKKSFIVGDFNLDCLKFDVNEKIRSFYDHVFEKDAIPIINRPTRVSDHSATLIDNIITTEVFEKSLIKGIIKTDVSDHFPIFFAINNSKRQCNEPNKKIRKRIFNEANLESFKEQLSLLHWQHIDFTIYL